MTSSCCAELHIEHGPRYACHCPCHDIDTSQPQARREAQRAHVVSLIENPHPSFWRNPHA